MKTSPLKNKRSDLTFEEMVNERIEQMEKKVNTLCIEQDSLMPLLYDSVQFERIKSQQKQLQVFEKRVKQIQKATQYEQKGQQKIDRNYWEEQINLIQSMIHQNEICLQSILTDEDHYRKGQQQLDARLKMNLSQIYLKTQNQVYQRMARFKNQYDLQNLKLTGLENCQKQRQAIKHIIDRRNQLTVQKIRSIQENLDFYLLALPEINLEKYHQFSYNRINYEILVINDKLQGYFKSLRQTQTVKNIQKKQLYPIYDKIQRIKWQIQGDKAFYLSQLSMKYSNSTDPFLICKLEDQINHNIQDLVEKAEEVSFKYQKLQELLM